MLHIEGNRTLSEYMGVLETSTTIYIDNNRLQRYALDSAYRVQDLKYLCLAELRKECGGRYSTLTKSNLIEYLEEQGVDFSKKHFTTKSGEPSLDLARVVSPLIERGIGECVLSLYKEYRTYSSYASYLRKMSERYPPFHSTTGGRVILEYPTHLAPQENLRVYYNDIAVVSIPRPYGSMVAGPTEEHHLAWCDYPQADWRFAYNLFIRDDENESIMRECTDAYEGLVRLVKGADFNPEEFKEVRKEYKVDCLSVFYNSTNNKPIPKSMRDFFRSCPRYQRYYYDLSLLYRFKLPVPVTSYFGYEQLIPEASYDHEFISKGLNTPIQTFTSHVINETVLGLLERFWDLGYTKDDINIYYVRHDELILYFKDTILKDSWIFKDCADIHIDGFTPIHLDFHFGDYYKEEDKKLTDRIEQYMNSSDDRLHTYPVGVMKDYNPVPSVESVYMGVYGVHDGVGHEYRFYNQRTGEVYRYRSNLEDIEAGAAEVIKRDLVGAVGNPRYLLVQNADYEWMDAVGPDDTTLLKVIRKTDSTAVVILRGQEQQGA